jgi:hypothetical protein
MNKNFNANQMFGLLLDIELQKSQDLKSFEEFDNSSLEHKVLPNKWICFNC